jgi:hypothetical protein
MTDLTDEAVKALKMPVTWKYRWKIDGEYVGWRYSDASNFHLSLDGYQEEPLYSAKAIAQARADAQAAVALVVEKAAERLDLAEHDAEERDWRSGANAFAALAKDIRALATADGLADLEALREERDDAQREAVELASFMAKKFHPDVPQWRPLDYPAGVISQIDNMVAGLTADFAAAQAQIEALRDAGRARNDAVDVYNARLAQVRQQRSAGDWSQNLDPEYQAMEKAKRGFIEAAESLATASATGDGGEG